MWLTADAVDTCDDENDDDAGVHIPAQDQAHENSAGVQLSLEK